MGIDKGNTNAVVMEYDSILGVRFPSISGQEGGGNQVHLLYEVQATPTTIVIQPDGYIVVPQIYPPAYNSVVDSVTNSGGIPQECLTSVENYETKELVSISPNPVHNFANIILDLKSDRYLEIKIYNLTGQVVSRIDNRYYSAGKNTVEANLSGEPEGFYFVQALEGNNVITTKKLILTK